MRFSRAAHGVAHNLLYREWPGTSNQRKRDAPLIAHVAPIVTSSPPRAAQPRFSSVSLIAEWRHFSRLIYAVPVERARALLPRSFEATEVTIRRRRCALLSVSSFTDHGYPAAPERGQAAFEQTNYCLHARRHGEACDWLLGLSLGSLSAVAPRGLWSLPWHLSAMALEVSYASAAARYHTYRVQTQSQWANARWELSDTGLPLDLDPIGPALDLDSNASTSDWRSRLSSTRTTYFARRDGALGAYRTSQSNLTGTRAHLEVGQCDLLERLGLLTSQEVSRPYFTLLQPSLTCHIQLPSPLNFAKEML